MYIPARPSDVLSQVSEMGISDERFKELLDGSTFENDEEKEDFFNTLQDEVSGGYLGAALSAVPLC